MNITEALPNLSAIAQNDVAEGTPAAGASRLSEAASDGVGAMAALLSQMVDGAAPAADDVADAVPASTPEGLTNVCPDSACEQDGLTGEQILGPGAPADMTLEQPHAAV